MLTWNELKEGKLGQTFDSKALKEVCTGVYGGISWPGKKPGFAVVVATNSFKTLGRQRHEVCLLDEVESADMWGLIERCSGLDLKYDPMAWIGDNENPIADEFMREMRSDSNWCAFSVTPASILAMDRPYQYMLQSLRRMLRKDSRRLFLKNSRVVEYMREIEGDAELELELGEFPAVEALAFAVLEGKRLGSSRGFTLKEIHALQRKYGLCD
jgi:hypothetical protein